MIGSTHLKHPFVFFAYVRLVRSTGTPYPVGACVMNLRDELDDDDGRERITKAGNVWTVADVVDDDRYIGCEATGAAIVPTVTELDTQFLLVSVVYRRYEIRPRLAGGYSIVRDGHIIQFFVADIQEAKDIIDAIVEAVTP